MVCPAVAVWQGRLNLCLHAQLPTRQCQLIRNEGRLEPAGRLALNPPGKEAAPLPACGRVARDEESAARTYRRSASGFELRTWSALPARQACRVTQCAWAYTANHVVAADMVGLAAREVGLASRPEGSLCAHGGSERGSRARLKPTACIRRPACCRASGRELIDESPTSRIVELPAMFRSDRVPKVPGVSPARGAAYGRDISHSCRSPASAAR